MAQELHRYIANLIIKFADKGFDYKMFGVNFIKAYEFFYKLNTKQKELIINKFSITDDITKDVNALEIGLNIVIRDTYDMDDEIKSIIKNITIYIEAYRLEAPDLKYSTFMQMIDFAYKYGKTN